MRVEVKLTGMDGVIKTLQELPPEVVSKNGGPVKLSLAKGARTYLGYQKQALIAAIAQNGEVESTGLLLSTMIASRGKRLSSGKGERYLVRFKRKTYPDRKGRPVTTLKTANLLEYGSSNQPATPFIRPTVQARGGEIIRVITDDLKKRLEKLIKQKARQNKQ
jgi:hypothetical protein